MRTIQSDSLQFVLLGPDEGRDRVLVRSSNASIELIGFAASLGLGEHGSVYSGYDYDVYDEDMHSVSSDPIEPSRTESDRRRSSYRFCWAGKCTARQRKEIEKKLNTHINKIRRALEDSDQGDLEWALATLVYACSSADKLYPSPPRRGKYDFPIRAALIMGFIAILLAVIQMVLDFLNR